MTQLNQPAALKISGRLNIEIFGLKVQICWGEKIDARILRRRVFKVLPNCRETSDISAADYIFELNGTGPFYQIKLNGAEIGQPETEEFLLDYLESNLRLTVAEFAVGKVFLHAGVVGWENEGIILPATSFDGKTTLVSELVRRGATYYSDEYAVLDDNADVHPFPKMLSVRGITGEYTQVDLPVEVFGGAPGSQPIPVGMVLLTRFEPEAKWMPEILTPGQGIMEILPHTFPIQLKPKFTLNILNKMASRAIIVKTSRGEAKKFADIILKFFEKRKK